MTLIAGPEADTWQMTMRELAKNSTVVMMGLRSFSPADRGCVYELERLLDSIELDRVLLLVDDTTDHEYLGRSCAAPGRCSAPNRRTRTWHRRA